MVWVTGHSLGAALATLATIRLTNDGIPVNGLYTYGCPRVGEVKFRSLFEENVTARAYRLVNNNDIVARIPIPGFFRFK